MKYGLEYDWNVKVTDRLSEAVCVNTTKTTDYSSNSGTELHKLELLHVKPNIKNGKNQCQQP